MIVYLAFLIFTLKSRDLGEIGSLRMSFGVAGSRLEREPLRSGARVDPPEVKQNYWELIPFMN